VPAWDALENAPESSYHLIDTSLFVVDWNYDKKERILWTGGVLATGSCMGRRHRSRKCPRIANSDQSRDGVSGSLAVLDAPSCFGAS
jgi:hypothetical protein